MTRVLVVCNDRVGNAMAGPAIRCWEMARALAAAGHAVRLSAPYPSDRAGDGFELVVESEAELRRQEGWADVIVVQGFVLTRFPRLAETGKHLVVDMYDPFVLEGLEMYGDRPPEARRREHWPVLGTTLLQLQLGDFFLCANERQRDFWMGGLMAVDRVNPSTHAQDRLLRRLIDVVPFGLNPVPPAHSGRPAVRGVLPGFDAESRVAIWAGGIYNWFDPLSLVRAWPAILERVPEARLLMLGVKHPNPTTPDQGVAVEAIRLAERLGLRDRSIHFNQDWVDYDRRKDYLLEADVGVSLHLEHVETRLSFRTRYLDYIWAGLPIVGTEGDWFADWIVSHGTGRVVPYGDVDAVVSALVEMLGDAAARERAAAAVAGARDAFTWPRALAPLLEYCERPWRAADRAGANRVAASRVDHLARIFSGELLPPAALVPRLLWYRRREGTRGLAARVAKRLRRALKERGLRRRQRPGSSAR